MYWLLFMLPYRKFEAIFSQCEGGPKDKTMLRHKIDCDKCPERILLFCQVFVFLSFFYSMFLSFFFIYYVLHKKRIICHFYNSESSTTDNQTKREVEETIKNYDFELYWALICCTNWKINCKGEKIKTGSLNFLDFVLQILIYFTHKVQYLQFQTFFCNNLISK